MAQPYTPKDYVVELGIDGDLKAGSVYPLQIPLARVEDFDSGVGEPAWFTQFNRTDRLAFRIWDIGTHGLSIVDNPCSFKGVFRDPASGGLSSPLGKNVSNPIDYDQAEIHGFAPKHKVAVYPNVGSGWKVGDQPFFTLVREGRFLLQVTVEVVIDPSAPRTYRSDPEVVVGEGSGPIPRGCLWRFVR